MLVCEWTPIVNKLVVGWKTIETNSANKPSVWCLARMGLTQTSVEETVSLAAGRCAKKAAPVCVELRTAWVWEFLSRWVHGGTAVGGSFGNWSTRP